MTPEAALAALEAAATADEWRAVTFIDIWDVLADDAGEFTFVLPGADGGEIVIRDPDGIHYTEAGAVLVAERILEVISADW